MIPQLRPERIIDALLLTSGASCKVIIHPFLYADLVKLDYFKRFYKNTHDGSQIIQPVAEYLVVNDVYHALKTGETGDPTIVLIIKDITTAQIIRVVQWKPLQDFTEQELLEELQRRNPKKLSSQLHVMAYSQAKDMIREVFEKIEKRETYGEPRTKD